MACSIINSLGIVEPIWKPFAKRKSYNPFGQYIKNYEDISASAKVLSELYPAYGVGWVRIEIEMENFFKYVLNKWDESNTNRDVITIDDALMEVRICRKYLYKNYKKLKDIDRAVKKSIRSKIMLNMDDISYLDRLKKLDLTA